MTRTTQKLKIQEIDRQLLLMANLAEQQINECMEALKELKTDELDRIVTNDDKIDLMQKEIEESCIKFIATEQPLAKDLRRVFTSTKIVTDIERIADYSVDICKIINRISGEDKAVLDKLSLLWDMEEYVRKMLDECINAYIQNDKEKALQICKKDDKVDDMYKSIFTSILGLLKQEDGINESYAQLLFVTKYLERMGDHITNICEWIIFSATGNYVDLNE